MARRRLKNILIKEWLVMTSDANNVLLITLLPLLIVGELILYVWAIDRFAAQAIIANPLFQAALEKMRQALPMVGMLSPREQLQVLSLDQFNFFILLIPTMIAMNFAAFSIVEEKLSRSLEPLLATPVRTWELLLGKALSGAVPALLMTWVCAGIFVGAVEGLGWGRLLPFVLTPSWFLSVFLVTPAVAVLSFVLGVIGSSRSKDPRSAQTIALVIVLPVLALIAVQVTGLLWFTPLLTVALALGLFLIDAGALRVAVSLFQRESIVVKWR